MSFCKFMVFEVSQRQQLISGQAQVGAPGKDHRYTAEKRIKFHPHSKRRSPRDIWYWIYWIEWKFTSFQSASNDKRWKTHRNAPRKTLVLPGLFPHMLLLAIGCPSDTQQLSRSTPWDDHFGQSQWHLLGQGRSAKSCGGVKSWGDNPIQSQCIPWMICRFRSIWEVLFADLMQSRKPRIIPLLFSYSLSKKQMAGGSPACIVHV